MAASEDEEAAWIAATSGVTMAVLLVVQYLFLKAHYLKMWE